MIITIICDVLGEENNGTTITSKRLIDNLKARGHEVRVVSPSPINEPGYYKVGTYNFGVFNKYVAKNGVSLAKANKPVILQAIEGADIVHIMLPFSLGQAAIKICKQRHLPVTAGFHTQAENVTAHVGLKNARYGQQFGVQISPPCPLQESRCHPLSESNDFGDYFQTTLFGQKIRHQQWRRSDV